MHDVGKIFVPEPVLNRQSSLSEDEFNQVKMHSRWSGEILSTIPDGERVQKAVEGHHERVDGSGYPSGLRGEDIPLWARIIAVADAYVNLTSDRTLAPGKTSEQAITEIEKASGVKYDGMLVRVLTRELKSERSLPGLGS